MSCNRDKALPELPIGTGDGPEGHVVTSKNSASENASDPNKVLPVINIEDKFSAEDMDRLHDLWNETSAHVHRRRNRQQKPLPPSPVSVPETENVPIDLSSASTVASSMGGSQRFCEFFRTKKTSDGAKAGTKTTNPLQSIRSKAQQRLMNKLKCAKSTPNLSGRVTGPAQAEARTPPKPSKLPVPPKPALVTRSKLEPGPKPGADLPLEELDINDGEIYLTFDPEWRTSSGDVLMTFLTPLPQDPLARPDSPLLHRHRSLCELSTLFHVPERRADSSAGAALHPIDELHSYLEM